MKDTFSKFAQIYVSKSVKTMKICCLHLPDKSFVENFFMCTDTLAQNKQGVIKIPCAFCKQ